jgi:hypothetical protein
MKLLLTLASLIILLACTPDNQVESTQVTNKLKSQEYNGHTLLGYWYSTTDNSSMEFYNNAMYLYTDTLQHLFNWDITQVVYRIRPVRITVPAVVIQTYDEPIQLTYTFLLRTLTDSTLILYDNKLHEYKLIWRW